MSLFLSPRRTPGVQQLEPSESAAACLGMVLGFYGRWVPLEELRLACGVTRDGSKASNILKAARGFGLAAKGFRKSADDLGELPIPSIVHWNFNHFVVFEGFHRGQAWLHDPAQGRRTVPRREFVDKYTGVVLAMEPTPRFSKGGPKPGLLAPLLALLGRSWAALGLLALTSVLLVLPGLLLPGLARLFVDKVLADHLTAWLLPLCLMVLAAGGAQALLVWLQQLTLRRMEGRLSAVLAARVMGRMLALPMSFLGQRSAAELAGRVTAADAVASLLSGQVAGTAFALLAVLAYAVAMALFDWMVALVALLVPVLHIMLLRRLRRRLERLAREVAQDLGQLTSYTTSTIQTIETLKVSGGEGEAFARWAGLHARAAAAERSIGAINASAQVAPAFLHALGAAAVLVVGGWRVMDGALTVGSLVAMQMLLASFTAPFLRLVELFEKVQQVRGDLSRVAALLAQAPPAPPPAPPAGDGSGTLELRDVTFGYSRTDLALVEGFSLSLAPGRRVALVGGSGSGKSTLGRLLAGLLEPWSGEILFDGRPLAAIPPGERASALAHVDQDIFLFAGSVRDNLTLWDATVPEAALIEALKDAALHADVASRPGGLEAMVAEGGGNFSGGQRQRLELARALVGNPAVLVMDEATAALDPLTEMAIDAAIRRRGCACVIIAHRLSTIRDADEILVLEHGQVVERGSHATLLAEGGAYQRLLGAMA